MGIKECDIDDLVDMLSKLEDACDDLDAANIKYEVCLDICFDLMKMALRGGRMERKLFLLSIRDAAKRIRLSISWVPEQADVMKDYAKTPPGSLKLNSYIYKAVKPFAEKQFED